MLSELEWLVTSFLLWAFLGSVIAALVALTTAYDSTEQETRAARRVLGILQKRYENEYQTLPTRRRVDWTTRMARLAEATRGDSSQPAVVPISLLLSDSRELRDAVSAQVVARSRTLALDGDRAITVALEQARFLPLERAAARLERQMGSVRWKARRAAVKDLGPQLVGRLVRVYGAGIGIGALLAVIALAVILLLGGPDVRFPLGGSLVSSVLALGTIGGAAAAGAHFMWRTVLAVHLHELEGDARRRRLRAVRWGALGFGCVLASPPLLQRLQAVELEWLARLPSTSQGVDGTTATWVGAAFILLILWFLTRQVMTTIRHGQPWSERLLHVAMWLFLGPLLVFMLVVVLTQASGPQDPTSLAMTVGGLAVLVGVLGAGLACAASVVAAQIEVERRFRLYERRGFVVRRSINPLWLVAVLGAQAAIYLAAVPTVIPALTVSESAEYYDGHPIAGFYVLVVVFASVANPVLMCLTYWRLTRLRSREDQHLAARMSALGTWRPP